MKINLFFLLAFFYTGYVFSQDSSDRKAIGKQSTINNISNSNKPNLNQSAKNTVSVNSSDSIPHQTTGDYQEKKRIPNSENGKMDDQK